MSPSEAFFTVERLVLAVHAGKVRGVTSAEELGISRSTFWRYVSAAEAAGVVFLKNSRGGYRYGNNPQSPKAWRIQSWGELKGSKPKCHKKASRSRTRTS